MNLKDKFDKTNFDLENPKPHGGPNSSPDHNHYQKYTPNKTYLDSRQSAASPKSDFGIEGNQIQNPVNIFSKTNLDLENPSPLGGPNNTNVIGYKQKYLPNGKHFEDTPEGTLRSNQSPLEASFLRTNLDVENPNNLGGPNRTNAGENNIPSGFYTNNRSGNKYGNTPGGPLMDKEGKIINYELQHWTQDKKYLDSFDADGNQIN